MTDSRFVIRPALPSDAGAINRIYNYYVQHDIATFDVEPWNETKRIEWLAQFCVAPTVFDVATVDNVDGGDNIVNTVNVDTVDKVNKVVDNTVNINTPYYALVAEVDKVTKVDNVTNVTKVDNVDTPIIGFACNTAFRARPAYRLSTETTVYADIDAPRGVGAALYRRLFELIARTSLHRAYAVIALPNARSVALHERFGFVHVGVANQVGHKFGKFVDIAWYEKKLTRLRR